MKAAVSASASPLAAGAAARWSRGLGCAACRAGGSGAQGRGGPPARRAARASRRSTRPGTTMPPWSRSYCSAQRLSLRVAPWSRLAVALVRPGVGLPGFLDRMACKVLTNKRVTDSTGGCSPRRIPRSASACSGPEPTSPNGPGPGASRSCPRCLTPPVRPAGRGSMTWTHDRSATRNT